MRIGRMRMGCTVRQDCSEDGKRPTLVALTKLGKANEISFRPLKEKEA